jgi:hypothetical protein
LRRKEIIEVEVAEDALKDIPALEKAYKAKFIQACVREGKATVKMLYPVERLDSEEVGVNVWNCQARLFIGQKTEDNFDLSPGQKEALEKWKTYVVYTENGGAINWSGIYLPSPFAVEILKQILAGRLEAINEIAEPSQEDFNQVAEALLISLERGDVKGLEIYNSIIRCFDGCRGYHTTQWLEYQNGQFCMYATGCHHALLIRGMWSKRFVKILTKQEAIAEVSEWLKQLAKKYDWTKYELTNADISYEYELDE